MNWKRKHSPDGQVYYYNTITNATTYNLADVKQSSVTKRRSLLLGDNGVVSVSGSEGIPFSLSLITYGVGKPLPISPPHPQATWIPGPKRYVLLFCICCYLNCAIS